eukprot:m.8498 g.8498  ORF g.8498 m.8498 type:complete len:1132 (+) comp3910_c0_seq1:200-3595(+)
MGFFLLSVLSLSTISQDCTNDFKEIEVNNALSARFGCGTTITTETITRTTTDTVLPRCTQKDNILCDMSTKDECDKIAFFCPALCGRCILIAESTFTTKTSVTDTKSSTTSTSSLITELTLSSITSTTYTTSQTRTTLSSISSSSITGKYCTQQVCGTSFKDTITNSDGTVTDCFCDPACKIALDCCPNYCEICEEGTLITNGNSPFECSRSVSASTSASESFNANQLTGTCLNACGKEGVEISESLIPRCSCRLDCPFLGDCCFDYVSMCVTTTQTSTTRSETSTSQTSISATTTSGTSTTITSSTLSTISVSSTTITTTSTSISTSSISGTSTSISDTSTSISSTTTKSTTSTSSYSSSTLTTVPCNYLLGDIVFIFDSSRSTGDVYFSQFKRIACDIVRSFDSLQALRFAAVTFSETSSIEFNLNDVQSDTTLICAAINNISYAPSDFTRLDSAFQAFSRISGKRNDVATELIVFSDGDTLNTNSLDKELENLNDNSVFRSMITYGDDTKTETTNKISPSGDIFDLDSQSAGAITSSLHSTLSGRLPCTSGCSVYANFVFVLDGSTSIQFPEAGGKSGTFDEYKEIVSSLVQSFQVQISRDEIRIAIVSFATNVSLHFNFETHKGDPLDMLAAIQVIPYDHEELGDQLTMSNLNSALEVVRKDVLISERGYKAQNPTFLFTFSDGQLRTTAVEELFKKEINLLPATTRFAFGSGSKQDSEILQLLATSDGGLYDLESQNDTIVDVTNKVSSKAQKCDGLTTTPKSTSTTSYSFSCSHLKLGIFSSCEALVRLVGCSDPLSITNCAQHCGICSTTTTGPTFPFPENCAKATYDNSRCIRCRNSKYLRPSDGTCVDAEFCDVDAPPLQRDTDGTTGRACVIPGNECDNKDNDSQCKPPKQAGFRCERSTSVRPVQCLKCEDNSDRVLINGKCIKLLRCAGKQTKNANNELCLCKMMVATEENDNCKKCKITRTRASLSHPAKPNFMWWLGKVTSTRDIDEVFIQCTKCKKGSLFSDNGVCVDENDCKTPNIIFSDGGEFRCGLPFTCATGISSSTGNKCNCPSKNCAECNYNSANPGSICTRCDSDKVLLTINFSISFLAGDCVSEFRCGKLFGRVVTDSRGGKQCVRQN